MQQYLWNCHWAPHASLDFNMNKCQALDAFKVWLTQYLVECKSRPGFICEYVVHNHILTCIYYHIMCTMCVFITPRSRFDNTLYFDITLTPNGVIVL